MSYISVPGQGTLRCCCEPRGKGWFNLWYTGDLDDLLASGIVTAEMLKPKPRRSRREVKEAQFHVLNRSFALRDGVPVPHHRIHFRAVPEQKAMSMPGALLAIRQYEWWQKSYEEREETVAPAAEQRVGAQVQSLLERFKARPTRKALETVTWQQPPEEEA